MNGRSRPATPRTSSEEGNMRGPSGRATKGDEKYPCPRCGRHFVEGERIQQSADEFRVREQRAAHRDVEWTHAYCPSKVPNG